MDFRFTEQQEMFRDSVLAFARKELAELLGTKVHLFLHVKVDEKWSDDKEIYEELGLEWVR